MFLKVLGIRGTFGFADYESGGGGGGGGVSDTNSHFGRIINKLLINFWIYHHLLILLIDFIINYY